MDPVVDAGHKSGLLAQIKHYGHVLLKWKMTIVSFFVVVVAVAGAYSFLMPPVFTSRGSIWIEDDPNILPFEDVQSLGPTTGLLSHTRLLKSRSLAADVVDKLKLYENADFAGRAKVGEKPRDPADPAFREVLIQKIIDNITVTAGERIRLVEVSFSSRNPKLAADILNALFDGYIDMIIRKRYSASEQASKFLNDQIAELRGQIEAKERELNAYGSEKDILPLSTAETPAVTRIGEVNNALTAATLDKINKLNTYNQLKAAPLGEIPNAPQGSLIQRLKEQYVTLSRQYATRLATVRPEYPEMQRLKRELDSATEALQVETQNLIRNAYNDYQVALRQEQSLQTLLQDLKNRAYRDNSNSVVYNSLKIELDNKKSLLETLSMRQGETDVSSRLKGMEAVNVWIVDKADFPLSPAFPDKRKNLFIAILLGLLGGAGLAVGLEYLNHTVKTSRDVAHAVGLPTLGSIPAFKMEIRPRGVKGEIAKIRSMFFSKRDAEERKRPRQRSRETPVPNEDAMIELIATRDPQSIQAESYRSIRTSLLVSFPPGRVKTILFTSALAKEGKSSTVSNLGITLAEANKRVVIVDSDLRRPQQARIFGLPAVNGAGLSRYLSSEMDPSDIVRPTGVANLHLITSGPLPANPIELLMSDRMDGLMAFLKRNFDFVLLDAPPLLAVSDALAMGPLAEAIVLIVRGGQTPIPAVVQAKQKFDSHKLKCLGVILNGVDIIEQDGYYAEGYYHYANKG
jgi:capsular exopolysaccharide synthesis family protein